MKIEVLADPDAVAKRAATLVAEHAQGGGRGSAAGSPSR